MNRPLNALVVILLLAAFSDASLGKNPFLCPNGQSNPALEPLTVHIAAEEDFYDAPRTDCLKSQFKPLQKREDDLLAWANKHASDHSQLFFARDGLIRVDSAITRFDLQALEAGLEEMKATGSPIMGRLEIEQALLFIAKLKINDGILSKKLAETCRKVEGTSGAVANYWQLEAFRRVRFEEYALIVQAYVRHRKSLGLRERDIVAFITPYWTLHATGLELRGLDDLDKVSILDLARFATWGDVYGRFDPVSPRSSRGDAYAPYHRLLRGVANVGGLANAHDDVLHFTYVHEIGHYLGLPHVFTTLNKDSTTIAACNDFVRASLIKESCECLFTGPKDARIFSDFDYTEAGIDDTTLAFRTDGKVASKHAACREASTDYEKYFDSEDTTIRNPLNNQDADFRFPPGWQFRLTPQQVEATRCMLANFK